MSKKPSKSTEQLKKIADKLRAKLNVLSNAGKIESEKMQKKSSNIEINSDSEMQALQLFENVKPAQQIKKKIKQAPTKKEDSSEQIKPSNLRSILRMPMGMEQQEEEEIIEDDDKKSKSVSFNFSENMVFCMDAERKWKDEIKNQKKGKFQLYEQKALGEAIGQYLTSSQISIQQFTRWLSFGSRQQKHVLRKQKFFSLLSSVLPNRSPMSCYKYVVRNFNSLNRQGQWSKQDVQKLLGLVDKFGRKWTLIGKEMGRTSDNVYDKYRSLGQEELQERVESLWKLRELISMIIEIERQFGDKFVDHHINKELDQQAAHDGQEQKERKEHKYNSKKFTFHNIEVVRKYIDAKILQGINLEKIKWKKVVNVVKTKNVFDCRNKLVQILQVLFRNNQSLDELLSHFLSKQKPTDQSNLNWKKWKDEQYSADQARNRFMILKKLVQGRVNKPFKQIYEQIIVKIKKMQEQAAKQKNKQ